MKIKAQIRCIGRLPETWQREAIHMYATRCSAFGAFEVLEYKEGHDKSTKPDIEKTTQKEAAELLKNLPSDALVIALDEQGKQLASTEFSKLLSLNSDKQIVFLIGGSWGLHQSVLDRANVKLSLGKMTLPHALARIILLEQIYRGLMIERGSEYHK
ncbi:MAG: 23S rRNA (pseudouridine(1915)-N(3))-methyltransferase RlmH [Patescibacteria group bacterium]